METFFALLAFCAGNSPINGEFLVQRPVTRSFDVFFDLHLNKRLSKQPKRWWFETPLRPLWRNCNVFVSSRMTFIIDICWYLILNLWKCHPVTVTCKLLWGERKQGHWWTLNISSSNIWRKLTHCCRSLSHVCNMTRSLWTSRWFISSPLIS